MKKISLITLLFLAFNFQSFANNLIIGTPSVSGSTVTFTIKWDNSWSVTTGPSNWDAVWVFVKRQSCVSNASSPWIHANLATSGNSVTGGVLEVNQVSDNKGVFIKRSVAGIGNISLATVTLTLSSPIGSDNIGVYGMEMVNIPQGEFYIGDGTTQNYIHSFSDGASTAPKLITAAIQSAGLGAVSNYQRDNLGSTTDLPAAFPLGYNRFYCMKYEITAGQYVAFLNTLSYNQQLRMQRDYQANTTPPESPVGTEFHCWPCYNNSARIVIATPGNNTSQIKPAVYANDLNANGVYNEDEDGLGLPVVMNAKNILAFLDWAAIRPMTEFEYEKACRGPLNPVMSEFSWGSTDFNNNYNVSNYGSASATNSVVSLGNTVLGTNRLYRVGMSATATSNRVIASATYYGISDMTGNVWETCIGGWGVDFSDFTTQNGDGNLYENGQSIENGSTDMATWTPNRLIVKGGGANWVGTEWPAISARQWVQFNNYGHFQGGRGVRSY
jgi:formylglycine-generating enzyme required for sulfatase activity